MTRSGARSGEVRFRNRLIAFLRGRYAAGEDAEDIVQEAYVRLEAWQQAGRSADDQDRFLWRTALNLATSLKRKQQVRARVHGDAAVVDLFQPAVSASTDEVCEVRERLMVVEQAIAALPDRCRAIFIACRIEGMTYSEAARAHGISVSAVEKNMARAIAQLTVKVQEFGQVNGGQDKRGRDGGG